MQAVSYTEARNNLKDIMDRACEDYEPYIITRKNGQNAVIISLEEYNGFKETAYLLSSPNNAKRLFESIEEAKTGKKICKDLIEQGKFLGVRMGGKTICFGKKTIKKLQNGLIFW